MSISASDSAWLTRQFDPIGIDALNETAAMLQRLDNKYILEGDALERALPALRQAFDVLEIGGRRVFGYESRYFDGPNWPSYFDHHQGRRKRAKVRTRRYLDSGACFVEIKLKDGRGSTIKRRQPCDDAVFGTLDDGALAHVRASYRAMYQADLPYDLNRTLDTFYTRMTLVAKQGGERLTIDNGLRFVLDGRGREIDDRLFILETKSENGNGLADRVLRVLHQHPVRHCSKYCAGMALLQDGLKHNRFRAAVRRLAGQPAVILNPELISEQP